MAETILVPHAGLRPTTEEEVAKACDALALTMGWRVERYEQRRRSNITLGLPDRRYVGANGFRVWVELKRPGGKLTAEQHTWLTDEQQAGALALPVDDVAQLARVFQLWRVLYGKTDALSYCREVTALVAQRGYRGERKTPDQSNGRGRRGVSGARRRR